MKKYIFGGAAFILFVLLGAFFLKLVFATATMFAIKIAVLVLVVIVLLGIVEGICRFMGE